MVTSSINMERSRESAPFPDFEQVLNTASLKVLYDPLFPKALEVFVNSSQLSWHFLSKPEF